MLSVMYDLWYYICALKGRIWQDCVNIECPAVLVINNKTFPVYYPHCLLTIRHSQICKKDHGPSIFTSPVIEVRQDRTLSITIFENVQIDNYVCQPWIEHPVFVPHCWTVYHITVHLRHYKSVQIYIVTIIANGWKIPAATLNSIITHSLSLISYCFYGVMLGILASGNPSWH